MTFFTAGFREKLDDRTDDSCKNEIDLPSSIPSSDSNSKKEWDWD